MFVYEIFENSLFVVYGLIALVFIATDAKYHARYMTIDFGLAIAIGIHISYL